MQQVVEGLQSKGSSIQAVPGATPGPYGAGSRVVSAAHMAVI